MTKQVIFRAIGRDEFYASLESRRKSGRGFSGKWRQLLPESCLLSKLTRVESGLQILQRKYRHRSMRLAPLVHRESQVIAWSPIEDIFRAVNYSEVLKLLQHVYECRNLPKFIHVNTALI